MILVDPRVGSGDMVPFIQDCGVQSVLCPLQYGDASFTGNGPDGSWLIGVEVKAIPDLLSCVINGRYADTQLVGMKSTYHSVWLVVEGEFQCDRFGFLSVGKMGQWHAAPIANKEGAWKYWDLMRWLWTIQIMANVKVIFTDNRRQSAHAIAALWHWWNDKAWHEHSSLKVFDMSGSGVMMMTKSLPLLWAKELPKIGWIKAQSVANKFKTGRGIANATSEEFMEIDGIGRKIAEAAVSAINGR